VFCRGLQGRGRKSSFQLLRPMVGCSDLCIEMKASGARLWSDLISAGRGRDC
jgi:hypothetical protein